LGGKGRFRGIELGAGEGFLIRAGECGEYYPHRDDPWRFLWIISDDDNMAKLFDVISPSGAETFKFTFFDAIEKVAYKLKHREYRIVGACEILSLFLEIFKHHEQKIRAGVEHSAQTYARIARECFDENVHTEISVDAVADILGVSRTYLYKIFVNAYGVSPRAYLSEARILRAKELLSAGKDTISAVAREVGYEDVLEFSKFFSRKTGISPSEYRKMKASDR
jgi:AraC-like DNA-binding protein